MKHIDKVKAIQFIRPNAEFVLTGDELTWLDQAQIQPTEEEIKAGYIAYEAQQEADKAQEQAAKSAAEAKLTALGLTADDLKALGL